jgi:LemA protein
VLAGLVFLGAIVLLVLFLVGIYNRLVTFRNRFKNAFAQIDVQLKRRYDLIPNLVETAKGYMKHERETLEAVIQARNQAAFASGASELEGGALTFVPRKHAGLVGVRDALDKLDRATPKLKKNLMRAVIASVSHDGKVTVGEGELLRTVADALSLPMPPFLPGQNLEPSVKAS